jgi:hypothetical protein
MMFVRHLALALVPALVAGCSSKTGGGAGGDVGQAPTIVLEARDLLQAGGPGRGPTQVGDLDKQKAMFPRGYDAIKTGEIVVLWGTPAKGEGEIEKGGPETVAAYEKNVPNEGGYVIMSGGTIKKMTASEFGSAPKAGKR